MNQKIMNITRFVDFNDIYIILYKLAFVKYIFTHIR